MSRESILLMDPAGVIVWANRLAHEIARVPAGGLLGRSYLEFTPPDTHAELLQLHRRKLKGETVRFRIDLGDGRVLSTTSGPVRVNGRDYLFAVGRWATGKPAGDEVLLGMLAAEALLDEKQTRVDLNALLISVLKEDARSLRGKLRLDPGNPPQVLVRAWPIRMVLRGLLLEARAHDGRATVSSGGDRRRAWVRISLVKSLRPKSPELVLSRRIVREQGGRLQVSGRTVTLVLPSAV